MKKGKITLATGPMFSGKSSWIIKELTKYNQKEILAFKFFLDKRYDNNNISSHNGLRIEAKAAKSEKEIIEMIKENPNVKTIGIDELQFFKPAISELLTELKNNNYNILTAGLNVDFNNKEWETTNEVKKISDYVKLFAATCASCGRKNATITYRKSSDNNRIIIGGSELYEPLCENDYKLAAFS